MQIFFHPTVPTGPGIIVTQSGSYYYAQIVGEPDSSEGAKTMHAAVGYLVEQNRERFELLPVENSRLNEAAPDLLAALESLLFIAENADETGYVTDHGFIDVESEQKKAHAAIAKATPQ